MPDALLEAYVTGLIEAEVAAWKRGDGTSGMARLRTRQ